MAQQRTFSMRNDKSKNINMKSFCYFRKNSMASFAFFLGISFVFLATQAANAQYPASAVDFVHHNKQYSGRYTISQLCPGKSQFPVTRKIDGALLSAQTDTAINCSVTFKTRTLHQHFLVRFEELLLGCDDHLRLLDSDSDYGQPSIHDFSCVDNLANTPFIKTTSSFLTLRYSSDGRSTTGKDGFRLVITAVSNSPTMECPADHGVCKNSLCIPRSLFCDTINHCLDNSDETNCSRGGGGMIDEMSMANSVVIIIIFVLVVAVLIFIILLIIHCKKDEDHYSRYQNHLQRLGTLPLHPSSSVMFNQYQYLPAANMSPYMSVPPQARVTQGYSTLPNSLTRQMNLNKGLNQQSPVNGPYVMMAGIPLQPMPMMMNSSPQDLRASRYQFKQPPQTQPYNLVLMGQNANQQTSQQQTPTIFETTETL